MARQDSRHRSPEKGKDAECTYSSETAQLRWTGHVTRMHEEQLPKKILYGELEMGKRSHGGQKKRYKDTHKASLKDFNIPTESWEQIAQDRAKWQGLIRRGASEYEAKRICVAEQKRAQHKARAKTSPKELSCSDLCCSICNRQFRARIGLISHLTTPGGRGFNPRRGRQHSFVEIDHEIFSTVILSLPLIQEGQLSVSGERMCTILVNRLED